MKIIQTIVFTANILFIVWGVILLKNENKINDLYTQTVKYERTEDKGNLKYPIQSEEIKKYAGQLHHWEQFNTYLILLLIINSIIILKTVKEVLKRTGAY